MQAREVAPEPPLGAAPDARPVEVDQEHRSPLVDQDVAGIQVGMDHAVVVEPAHRGADGAPQPVVAAMLLINVVMIKFLERDLIRSRIQSGKLLIRFIDHHIGRCLVQAVQSLVIEERFEARTRLTIVLQDPVIRRLEIVSSTHQRLYSTCFYLYGDQCTL